ncbi:hypothetical protein [Sutcliffiella deserti]|uniref:hypothetical protein n=1 Tax=Sutcliffiella deserti TaxID=2875501 RepID=UPI001CBC5C20|nr:hypothetical protein [Sutcliffiella deserti]
MGGINIFNKEKRWKKWEKERRLGKWKYIFLHGLLLCGSVSFLTQLALDLYQEDFLDIYGYLWFSFVFGLTYGIGSWITMEARYDRYLKKEHY